MEIFLDTANIDYIRKYIDLIDGITTNPTIIANHKGCSPNARESQSAYNDLICALGDSKISIQVSECFDYDVMLEQALFICKNFSKNTLVKLPNTYEGLRVCKAIKLHKGVLQTRSVNMTLTFSPIQALLAAKAGADYISVFVGRVNDTGNMDYDFVSKCVDATESYFDSKILVASIRSIEHVVNAVEAGAGAMTVPPIVLDKILDNAMTSVGLQQFADSVKNA